MRGADDQDWAEKRRGDTASARPSWLSRSKLQLSEHQALLQLGDFLTTTCAVVGALWLWGVVDGDQFTLGYLRAHGPWFVLVVAWMALFLPAYHPSVVFSMKATAAIGMRVAAAGVGCYVLIYFFAPRQLLPRLVILYFLGLAFILTMAWRGLYIRVFTRERHRYRVAVVGTGPAARLIADLLRRMAPHTAVVAFVDDGVSERDEPLGLPAVSGAEGLRDVVAERHVSELVLAPTGEITTELLRAVVTAQEAGVDVVRMATVYERLLRRIPIDHLESDWVLTSLVDAMRLQDASRLAKRALDILGGCVGCVVFVLLLPLLGTAIWLDTGRPILFWQQRVGLANRPFRLLKFRTMEQGAERDGPRWAGIRDRRVTRFGAFLRRSRLDELPQFFNVVKGDMSLVGPRPERPEFVAELEERIPFYRTRLLVRPGLTGWAQVNYRYGDTVADAAMKLEYDLYYIKRRTLLFDLAIAMRTVKTVLTFAGR